MKQHYWLLIFILLNGKNICSQSVDCKEQILDYTSFTVTDSTKWNLTLSNDDEAALIYFGAIHSKNPSHNQFEKIEEAWKSAKFDLALYEGPDRGFHPTRKETIEKSGESGFLRFIASRDSVTSQSLEPSPIDEIKYLSKYFSTGKIKLFFLLREAQRVRKSYDWDEPQVKNHIEKLLSKANTIPGLKDTVRTLNEIENAFRYYWGDGLDWWQAPSDWFDPLKKSKDTGGVFTNDINSHSSNFRDIYMYELISRFLHEGRKVFAVVGRNHVPMQSKALQCEWRKIRTSQ